jgi:diadenosine tetraphosphatase ApaH/serine/threonine PP2A family protein phosphatase
VSDTIFVVHGGLSPRDTSIANINAIDRFVEIVPPDTLFEDLLWSDPKTSNGISASNRGCAYQFGPDITRAFLEANGMRMLVRSHECCSKGYVAFKSHGVAIIVCALRCFLKHIV